LISKTSAPLRRDVYVTLHATGPVTGLRWYRDARRRDSQPMQNVACATGWIKDDWASLGNNEMPK
jgi:hypothetical protein